MVFKGTGFDFCGHYWREDQRRCTGCAGSPAWVEYCPVQDCMFLVNDEDKRERPRLQSPEDVELFFDVGEVFVAGGEGGFATGGEGGGKTIGIRKFMFGAKFGCGAC